MEDCLRNLLRLLVFCQVCFFTRGIGVPGLCGEEEFKCQCGSDPDITVDLKVTQCTFFYRWKPYCHACKNGNKISPSDVCPKYQRCAECHPDGASCSRCPPGKFGSFCEKTVTNGQPSSNLLNLNVSLGILNLGGRQPDDQGSRPVADCRCLNGGRCQGFDDFCTCPAGFKGVYCELRTGCPELPVIPPISVVRIPEANPTYIEYSCPRSGYLLEGSPRLNCIQNTGQWSHPPPTCVPACPLPSAPVSGLIANVSAETMMIKSGQSVDFQCAEGLVIMGASKTTCMTDTTWSHQTPFCAKASYCREPEPVVQSTYQIQVPPFQPPFTNGTRVVFSCTEGHLLMGQAQITCQENGQWSSNGPTCVKVYASVVDCDTPGNEVIEKVGTPVRIHCPPGCASDNGTVWGTVIYQDSSSVCRAAVHAGRIADNLGGSLFVVNNGPYNDFLPNNMNGVISYGKERLLNSFRFHHDPALEEQNRDDPDKGCPQGWSEVSGHCVYIVTKKHAWNAAKGICTNMGSRLPNPTDPAFLKELLRINRPHSDFEHFWLLSKSNSTVVETLFADPYAEDINLNPNITYLEEDNWESVGNSTPLCNLVSRNSDNPLWQPVDCDEESSFVCDINLRELQVTCEDPAPLENGFIDLEDPQRGFRRGAVLKYRCQGLHILRGEPTSTCLPDGTWSTTTVPQCQRIPACLDPPSVKFGSYTLLPPAPKVTRSRIAPVPAGAEGPRRSRIGTVLPPRQSRSAKPEEEAEEEAEELPPGHHPVGSRASYTCESRYYELVGSSTRRCQADGSWGGRPVTCLPVCGRSDSPRTPFITNGNSSDIGQWPWQVGVAQYLPDYSAHYLLCGGALLNELWVLTAAHCVTDEKTGLILDPEMIRLYAGKYYRDDKLDNDFVQIRRAAEIHVHPDYDPTLYDADIALIRMEAHVTLTSRVRPVCLPTDKSTRQNIVDGKKGVVIGWGLTESSEYAESLRHAVLPVVSHERCEEGYDKAGMPLSVSENMFCAGLEEGNTDACSGDSGGPMVFLVDSGTRKFWILEGIVSWGSPTGCGHPHQYGGFTKVHQFLDWINQYI